MFTNLCSDQYRLKDKRKAGVFHTAAGEGQPDT